MTNPSSPQPSISPQLFSAALAAHPRPGGGGGLPARTESLKQTVFVRLDGVVALKEDSFNRWIDDQSRNILFYAWQPEVQTQAAIPLGLTAGSADQQAAYAYLSSDLNRIVTCISDRDEL
jgi:hypothetical protein